MSKQFYLLRHGENDTPGDHDFPLAPVGFAQAYAAGQLFARNAQSKPRVRIYTSPLLRAVQTANSFAEAVRNENPNLDVEIVETQHLCTEGGEIGLRKEISALADQPKTQQPDTIICVGHQRPFGLLRKLQSWADANYSPRHLAALKRTKQPEKIRALCESTKTPLAKSELIGYKMGDSWQQLATPFNGKQCFHATDTDVNRQIISLSTDRKRQQTEPNRPINKGHLTKRPSALP